MTPYTKQIVELHKIHKAIENKECNGGGSNNSEGNSDIDYEAIYQFYRVKFLAAQELPNDFVISEHLTDVIEIRTLEYPDDTPGIWKATLDYINNNTDKIGSIVFSIPEIGYYIVYGFSDYVQPQ